jgi:antitoxin component YwqK of YwqJK toxin-antitoxin module
MRIAFLMILITIVGCATTTLPNEVNNQEIQVELPIKLSDLILKNGVYHDAENNKPFNGKVISIGKYSTGVGQLINGLRDGLWKMSLSGPTPNKRYFKDGFHIIHEYKKGERHGKSVWYTFDGRIESFERYKNGKQDGGSYSYFDNRQLRHKFNHKDGLEHGSQTKYYENGQLEYSYNTLEGKVTDNFIETFYKNGRLKSRVNYSNGKWNGESVHYYSNGNLETKTKYKNGKADGREVSYFENGTIESITENKNGKMHGEWASYREDGSLEFRGIYKSGELTELKGYNFEGELVFVDKY